jgi:hypothetical protein
MFETVGDGQEAGGVGKRKKLYEGIDGLYYGYYILY